MATNVNANHDKRLETLPFTELCDEVRTSIYTNLFKGQDSVPAVVTALLSLGFQRGVESTQGENEDA